MLWLLPIESLVMRKKCLVLALSIFPVRNFRPFKERIAIGGILRELSNVMRKPAFCIYEKKMRRSASQ